MAEFTWPFEPNPNFAPEDYDEAVEFNVELNVARSGRVTTQSLPGARWRTRLNFPSVSVAYLMQRRQLEAFFLQQRGGADRLLLWNLLTPEPLGTMRGAVTLAASVLAGASSAQLVCGSEHPNVLQNSGFEYDANADGLGNNWLAYINGLTGAVAYTRVTGNASSYAQRVDATNLGTSTSDQAGILYGSNVPAVAGQSWAFAADTRDSGGGVRLYIDWHDSSNSIIAAQSLEFATSGAAWVRRSMLAVAPPLTAYLKAYIWTQARPGSAGAASVEFDNVQLEQSAAASSYKGVPTLLRGDRISFAGQRVVLTADMSGADGSAQTVYFQPAHRAGASSGAAVTLVKPVTKYVMAQPVVQMAANGSMLPGFAVDLVEE